MTNVDDARRAYEAAKSLANYHDPVSAFYQAARLLLTNASQDYAQALVDDAQRKLDAMGVVIGETVVVDKGTPLSLAVVKEVRGNPLAGFAQCILKPVNQDLDEKGWAQVENLMIYTAPVVKGMVMYGPSPTRQLWQPEDTGVSSYRLTLSNVTYADLDAMKPGDMIEGTYKIERMK